MRYQHLRACGVAIALLSSWGCAATRPEKVAGDPAGDLRQARIEYRGVRTPANDITPASHSDATISTSGAVTTIEYPHPNGDRQSALVTVVELRPQGAGAKPSRLASFASWADQMLPGLSADERIGSAKGLKISKTELDELLRELVMDGGLESASDSPLEVAIEINGARQSSRPRRAASLERLTQRVRSEGLVLPVDHPHVLATLDNAAPSDGFYRSLESKGAEGESR